MKAQICHSDQPKCKLDPNFILYFVTGTLKLLWMKNIKKNIYLHRFKKYFFVHFENKIKDMLRL